MCTMVSSLLLQYQQTNPVASQMSNSFRSQSYYCESVKLPLENAFLRACPFLLSRGHIRNAQIKHVSILSIKECPKTVSLPLFHIPYTKIFVMIAS